MRIASPVLVRRSGQDTVVAFPAEIDIDNRDELLDQLLSLLNSGSGPLVVDMSATVFCDSSGVNLLLRANRRALLLGREMRLAVPYRRVRRVLEICGLERVLTIHRTVDAALLPR